MQQAIPPVKETSTRRLTAITIPKYISYKKDKRVHRKPLHAVAEASPKRLDFLGE